MVSHFNLNDPLSQSTLEKGYQITLFIVPELSFLTEQMENLLYPFKGQYLFNAERNPIELAYVYSNSKLKSPNRYFHLKIPSFLQRC